MAQKLLIALSVVMGCASCAYHRGVEIDNLSDSLASLQQVATSVLPLGVRLRSQNSREFFSEYFIMRDGIYERGTNARERRHVRILIFGERRPYTLAIEIPVELRDRSGRYSLDRYDEAMARVFMRRIQKALAERREDRNIIDDFRAF